jgi:hypothetical protein
MSNETCKACGKSDFAYGSDHTFVRPLNKKFTSVGSNKIFKFCKHCGEVASIRIENPEKFQ